MPEILIANVDEDLYKGLSDMAKARGVDVTELMMDALRRAAGLPSPKTATKSLAVPRAEEPVRSDLPPHTPPADWVDPLAAKFGDDPNKHWLLEFRRKHWDGLMSDEEHAQFTKNVERKEYFGPSLFPE